MPEYICVCDGLYKSACVCVCVGGGGGCDLVGLYACARVCASVRNYVGTVVTMTTKTISSGHWCL